jgi:hypothetical protein
MRSVDLAVYADALAGEAAALAARAERERSRIRQAAIERIARTDLAPATVTRLEELGLLTTRSDRGALRDLEEALAALDEFQSWVERQLASEV